MDDNSLPLFSTNPCHPLNRLSFENQKCILGITMNQFREIPLCSGGYNEEGLRFYDGVLGNLIRTRDSFGETGAYDIYEDCTEFATHWEYRGDVFRVLDKAYVYRKDLEEPYLKMPAIKWHGMIASWSESYDFTTGFNKIYNDLPYTIIHANTKESVGIDVNKLGEYLGCFNQYTADENEVIFPMKKDFVVKVYKNITPNDFKKMMEDTALLNKQI